MNSTTRIILLFLALACMAAPGPAAAQEARTIGLDEALALFAENNLELRLARAEAGEAAALARQAAAWPNLLLTASQEELSGDGRDASESYLNLSQRLEWPGTRTARIESAERAAASARARFAADSARMAYQVKEAYTRAAGAQRDAAVLAEVTQVFREGQESAEERYAEGDLSLYDRRRIQVERTRYENRLAEAELKASAARRHLVLLVLPEGEALELAPTDSLIASPPRVAPEAALARALERRWELVAAEEAVASARASASLARRERIPDLTATGGYKRQSDGLDGIFLGLSLPLPFWDRRRGAIEAAEVRVTGAESRESLVRRQVVNDVQRALETYRSLSERADLLAGDGDGADLLEIARVGYAEGEMELLDLLDAAEAFLEARLAEARLRADLWTGYYDLERAVGGFDGSANDVEDDR